jgi:hypothetical protein
MMALFFLIGSFLMGIGLVRRIFPFTTMAERIFWGTTLGSMVATWAAYLISRILHDLHFAVLVVLALVMWAITGFLFYKDREHWQRIRISNIFKGNNRFLALLLLLFAPIFLYFFYTGMFHPKSEGLYLTATSWYDMALHLAIATSFAYGQNFPPIYTILPSEPLRYPFLPDFHASVLMKLGFGIWPSFGLTSFVMAVALVGIVYHFARRLVDSSLAALIATLLFFFNGGLGFLFFFKDWRASNKSLIDFFFNMEQNYTDMWSRGIKWQNLITSGLIPRRALLFGMPIAFIVFTLFAIIWRDWSGSDRKEKWNGYRTLFAAGVITGLLPLFDTHTYAAVGFISVVLFLIRRRREWLAYWIPAVLVALPQVLNLSGHVASSRFLRFQPGWISYIDSSFFLFIIRNFGLPLLLIVPALIFAPKYLRTFYVPFPALMVFCFIYVVSPNELDNEKLMYYAYAATALVIAAWLAQLAQRRKLRGLVVLIVLCCTLSGVLSVIMVSRLVWRIFSPEEIEVGNFARDKLPPKAMFLSGQNHNQPVLCFAGKPIVLGYDFWIISHGYDRVQYDAILKDVKTMYDGGDAAVSLLQKYKVKYIYVGPYERTELKANESYFNSHHAIVFRNKDMTIYDAQVIGNSR